MQELTELLKTDLITTAGRALVLQESIEEEENSTHAPGIWGRAVQRAEGGTRPSLNRQRQEGVENSNSQTVL